MPNKTALSVGRLRHRVRIERLLAEGFDDQGRRTAPSWRLFAEVWAEIAPISSRDAIVAAQTASKVSARITVMYRAGIDATMRIVHRGTIYAIEGIRPDRDSGIEYLTIDVASGVNRG